MKDTLVLRLRRASSPFPSERVTQQRDARRTSHHSAEYCTSFKHVIFVFRIRRVRLSSVSRPRSGLGCFVEGHRDAAAIGVDPQCLHQRNQYRDQEHRVRHSERLHPITLSLTPSLFLLSLFQFHSNRRCPLVTLSASTAATAAKFT